MLNIYRIFLQEEGNVYNPETGDIENLPGSDTHGDSPDLLEESPITIIKTPEPDKSNGDKN